MDLFRKNSPEEKKLKEITGNFLLSQNFLNKLESAGLTIKEGILIQKQLKQEIKENNVNVNSLEKNLNYLITEEYKKNKNDELTNNNINKFEIILLVFINSCFKRLINKKNIIMHFIYILLIFLLPLIICQIISHSHIIGPLSLENLVSIINYAFIYLILAIIISYILNHKYKNEMSYWIMICLGILTCSFFVGSIFTILKDNNSGSYAVATASILGVIITLIFTKKDSMEQMKKTEDNILIQTTYEPMKNALIDLDTYVRKKTEENYSMGDAWTFTKIFESLLGEKFYTQLPDRIRNEIISNIKKIDLKYGKLEYMGYVYKGSKWNVTFSSEYNDLKNVKKKLKERIGIKDEDNDWGFGIFYFISNYGPSEFDLNTGNKSSHYNEISELLMSVVKEKDNSKSLKIQGQIASYKFKNDKQVLDEILNPVLEIINNFLKIISVENTRNLILEDIKKFNQD